jgi:Xaa-Pro dipeptidase
LCHRILIKKFIELGIFKGDETNILNSGISASFYPHGVGHSLGLDVHDVPTVSKPESGEGRSHLPDQLPEKASHLIFRYLRLRIPLEEGMVVVSSFRS